MGRKWNEAFSLGGELLEEEINLQRRWQDILNNIPLINVKRKDRMKRKQIFDVGFQPYCSVSGSEGDSAQQYKK